MKRQMIKINEERCDGCGLCIGECQEGALALVDGKAKLVREDCCDGLGNCLPACPRDAISFEARDAPAFVENPGIQNVPCNCSDAPAPISIGGNSMAEGELSQWPIQIKLVPVKAPWFDGRDLLIAADCTAFAVKEFHEKFIKGHITIVGCPKLDSVDYSEKLSEIFRSNDICSVTLVRMEVPCCGGMTRAAREALKISGKNIPMKVYTVSREGKVLNVD
ncbi:MAG: ATP-binding protein [Candidatus Methanomethylophilaceae archaeon]